MNDLAQQWNSVAPAWAGAIWRASWEGGVAVIVAWVLCLTFPRIPARARCWLWRLALAKLVVGLLWIAPIKLALLSPLKKAAAISITGALPVGRQPPIAPLAVAPLNPMAPVT